MLAGGCASNQVAAGSCRSWIGGMDSGNRPVLHMRGGHGVTWMTAIVCVECPQALISIPAAMGVGNGTNPPTERQVVFGMRRTCGFFRVGAMFRRPHIV